MIILLIVIAIVVAGIPLAAVVLVTVASRSEEHAGSIAGRAPGRMEHAARRLLAFHAAGIGRPACRARTRTRAGARAGARARTRAGARTRARARAVLAGTGPGGPPRRP